jgi:hypothetical protein
LTQAFGSHAAPVTVYSPVSLLSPTVTWSVPRAASSEPSPVAGAHACGVVGAFVCMAAVKLMTPWPLMDSNWKVLVAVPLRRFLT